MRSCDVAMSCARTQDLIARLLERKPAKRLGMLNGRAQDIKNHKWFETLPWAELEARR
jgi:cGMP-dependent protein kinase 2